ncbi:MAG: ABC transporter permease [Verrucomicrobia bacterium]|nr:ABC transporter permease [Verrucomicrobiota bacterium]MDA1085678.1 ABC transporter permease [Verrucomicrobiota bacterium]
MKEIRVSDQPRLGFRRVLRITADGIRYRLFRASVTVAVIAVAVAFLLNILSESLIKRAVARDTRDHIEQSRLVHSWTSRLGAPGTAETILNELANTAADDSRVEELTRMGGLGPDELVQFQRAAGQTIEYMDFFAGLDYARRRRLVHQAEGLAIFDRLAGDANFQKFVAILRETPSVRLTSTPDALREFLAQWPRIRIWTEHVQAGQAIAVARIAAGLNGRDLTQALAAADRDFGHVVREAGFALDEESARVVAGQARQILDQRTVEKSLEHRAPRQIIARYHDILPGDVTTALLWDFVSEPSRAAQYLKAMQAVGISGDQLQPDRVQSLARHWHEMNRMERAGRLTADMEGGWLGLGQRMAWLLLVSMLVCAIGISNAMLMTVTERFREIATLKCLGALDGTIMTMFVLESCMMGVVGGIAGGLLGALIGSSRMLVAFGPAFAGSIPLVDLAASMGVAILFGVVLAAVAAIYPSFRAARLAPMEAMRVQ